MSMTIKEALAATWPEVIVGESYEFYAEMLQEYEAPERRMRNYTGQTVKVLAELLDDEREADSSRMFEVEATDGFTFEAMQEELNGWDKALGQFYGPSGWWGNEK